MCSNGGLYEKRTKKKRDNNSNTLVYISGGILAVAIIAFIITFVVYSNRLNSNSSGILDTQFLSTVGENNIVENTTSASSSMGKTVNESESEMVNTIQDDAQTEKNETNNINSSKKVEKTENKKVEQKRRKKRN